MTSVVCKKANSLQVSVLALHLVISAHYNHTKALDTVLSALNKEQLEKFQEIAKRFSRFFTLKSFLLGIILMSDKSAATDAVFNDMQPHIEKHLKEADLRERPFRPF